MIEISEWERGFSFAPIDQEDLRMYLWFYEWHLFDAFCQGQHTPGNHYPARDLAPDRRSGVLKHPGLELAVTAAEDGADLELAVTNVSEHPWPDIAAIIPCFNPGQQPHVAPTEQFFDDGHERTWFLGKAGLERLVRRDIHFNGRFREQIDAQATDDRFVFSQKWPTSSRDAGGGLLLRESADGEWVAGIAWAAFVSLQGHNPWRCLHQSIRVGPLSPGQSKRIRGRIYLFQGTRDACLARYQAAFGSEASAQC
jgi:hypothetical protein